MKQLERFPGELAEEKEAFSEHIEAYKNKGQKEQVTAFIDGALRMVKLLLDQKTEPISLSEKIEFMKTRCDVSEKALKLHRAALERLANFQKSAKKMLEAADEAILATNAEAHDIAASVRRI